MSKGRMQSKQHGQFKFSQFGFLFLSSKSAKSKNENSGVHEALAKREMPPGQTEKLKQRWTRDHRQGREPTHPPSTVFRIDIPGKPRSTYATNSARVVRGAPACVCLNTKGTKVDAKATSECMESQLIKHTNQIHIQSRNEECPKVTAHLFAAKVVWPRQGLAGQS